MKEETGYDIGIVALFSRKSSKYTHLAKVVDGDLRLDSGNPDNEDILDVQWVSLNDYSKFDSYTLPFVKKLLDPDFQ